MEIHMIVSEPARAMRVDVLDSMNPEDRCECFWPDAVARARAHLNAAVGVTGAAEIFSILGDPTRVRVLTALRTGELCVSDLATVTETNRSTISHQLRVLRSHRLVERRREGKTVFYAIADAHVEALLDMACLHAAESSGGRAGILA
jgi:DNA-binding transcriptional ArsR family regulator